MIYHICVRNFLSIRNFTVHQAQYNYLTSHLNREHRDLDSFVFIFLLVLLLGNVYTKWRNCNLRYHMVFCDILQSKKALTTNSEVFPVLYKLVKNVTKDNTSKKEHDYDDLSTFSLLKQRQEKEKYYLSSNNTQIFP